MGLPFRDPQELSKNLVLHNEYVVVLFENVSLKLNFYKALKQVNPGKFSPLASNILVVIIECGRPTIKHAVSGICSTLFLNCQTPKELLLIIRGVAENTHPEIGNCVLNTVIIENLSAFYWENKLLLWSSARQWYTEINRILQQIMAKYGCNVVSTMWDKNYEQGFNLRREPNMLAVRLSDLTTIPSEFFENSGHVYASQTSRSLRYTDAGWVPV